MNYISYSETTIDKIEALTNKKRFLFITHEVYKISMAKPYTINPMIIFWDN